MILDDLEQALKRGVKIRILTGNYLGITQPEALCLIKDRLGDRVDLRFYNEKERSFHPKAYIFRRKDLGEIYMFRAVLSHPVLNESYFARDCFDYIVIDEYGIIGQVKRRPILKDS